MNPACFHEPRGMGTETASASTGGPSVPGQSLMIDDASAGQHGLGDWRDGRDASGLDDPSGDHQTGSRRRSIAQPLDIAPAGSIVRRRGTNPSGPGCPALPSVVSRWGTAAARWR